MNRPVDHGPVAKLKALIRVACDKRLTKADAAVMAVIVDRIGATGEAWPSVNCISRDAGVDRATATRGIAHLVDTGHLQKTSGTRTTSNRYRLGRCNGAPRCEPAPSCESAPGVGASTRLQVGASTRPESVPLNLDNESGKEPADATRPPKPRSLTFDEWTKSLPDGLMAIPPNDPVFEYGDKAGIPADLMHLAWLTFEAKQTGGPKRSADWPKVFRDHIEGNWLKLWRVVDGEYVLTTEGTQAARNHSPDVEAKHEHRQRGLADRALRRLARIPSRQTIGLAGFLEVDPMSLMTDYHPAAAEAVEAAQATDARFERSEDEKYRRLHDKRMRDLSGTPDPGDA